MARPDISEERTSQILDAFAVCIGRAGVAGTSLQDVADAAGVHKSIIRHYVGSRDDLVNALTSRTIGGYRTEMIVARREEGLPGFLDSIFTVDADAFEIALFDSLTRASDEYPEASALVEDLVDEIFDVLVDELGSSHPGAKRSDIEVVSVGVVGMALAADSFGSDEPDAVRGLRLAADRLISTLGNTP